MPNQDFLRATPSVFVIGQDYEILVHTTACGIICIRIGDEMYYEENSGALSSEKSYAKVRLPQYVLDKAKEYTVCFRERIVRRAYYSQLGEEMCRTFSFRPLTKTDNINIYHTADIHYRFELALPMCNYFGDELDILVVNGDIGEVETEENYFEVIKFVGDVSRGEVPVLFARGNHDTRGHLAERFTDYFPADGKKTYFCAELGCLSLLVLDLGEDKLDFHTEYGGVNIFESYRRRELEFLKGLVPSGKLTLAIGHITPACNTLHTDDEIFEIEDELYRLYNTEMERLGVSLMVSGHVHRAFVLDRDSEKSPRPHSYPVVFGSACFGKEDLWGAALTLSGNTAIVRFTNAKGEVKETHTIDLATGKEV